nr:hypothetical protein [Tanacetum cinerariifolium]
MVLNKGINGPSVVKPKIAYNVHFDIKGQFMKELRDNTFAGNHDDDAHENVQKVLEIVDLFSILGVTHVAIMLRVFPITLTKASRRWKVGYEICKGMHLYKECPLREEGKAVEQVKYSEFGRSFLSNMGNEARYRVGPLRSLMRKENIEYDGGNANDKTRRNDAMSLWTCMYDGERTEVQWKDESNDYEEENIVVQEAFKAYTQESVYPVNHLDDDWYMGPTHDEDDLNCFGEYLELHASDGFIDVGEKKYKEKMCKLIGMTYKKPPSITIEKFKITRYTIGPKERYGKVKVKETDEIPKTVSNVDMVKAKLMEETDAYGRVQRTT